MASASALFQNIGPVRPGIVLARRIAEIFLLQIFLLRILLLKRAGSLKRPRNEEVRFGDRSTAKGFFRRRRWGTRLSVSVRLQDVGGEKKALKAFRVQRRLGRRLSGFDGSRFDLAHLDRRNCTANGALQSGTLLSYCSGNRNVTVHYSRSGVFLQLSWRGSAPFWIGGVGKPTK